MKAEHSTKFWHLSGDPLEYQRGLEDLVEAISAWRSDEFAFRVEQVNDREISVSLVTMGDQPMDW